MRKASFPRHSSLLSVGRIKSLEHPAGVPPSGSPAGRPPAPPAQDGTTAPAHSNATPTPARPAGSPRPAAPCPARLTPRRRPGGGSGGRRLREAAAGAAGAAHGAAVASRLPGPGRGEEGLEVPPCSTEWRSRGQGGRGGPGDGALKHSPRPAGLPRAARATRVVRSCP